MWWKIIGQFTASPGNTYSHANSHQGPYIRAQLTPHILRMLTHTISPTYANSREHLRHANSHQHLLTQTHTNAYSRKLTPTPPHANSHQRLLTQTHTNTYSRKLTPTPHSDRKLTAYVNSRHHLRMQTHTNTYSCKLTPTPTHSGKLTRNTYVCNFTRTPTYVSSHQHLRMQTHTNTI